MPRSSQGKDISCLALTFFYDFVESRGRSRRDLQAGLRYPPEHLDNRLNWIDYETFLTIERRVAELFPDEPDLYVNIGRHLGRTKGFGFIRVMIRAVTSPFQVYARIPGVVKRFLFPFVDPRFERTGRNTMCATYTFAEGYQPTDAWFLTVRGMLEAVPTMMGAPAAAVVYRRVSEQTAEFDITLRQWLGPVEFVRGVGRNVLGIARMRLRNLGDAAVELEETNRLLLEKVEDLTRAQGELHRKVRDLSVLNALARNATSELDLERLLRNSVAVISDELGGVPAAVLMPAAAPVAWAIAAAAHLAEGEPEQVRRLAARLTLASSRAAAPYQAEGWTVLPMRSAEELVGVLVLSAGSRNDAEELERPLLTAIADQLAVAVANAVSWQVINDLRHNLERRVRERTAELDEARGKLEDTVARLEQSDRARRDFFTNVSHEIKTPLTLILAPLDDTAAALRQAGHAEAVQNLGMIRDNARSLLRLVNEILDFAKLDEGRLPLAPELVDVAAMVEDVTAYLRPLAERRDVSLTCERPDGPLVARLDPKLVRRALVNLVVNAIKYIDPGDDVRVRLARADDEVRIEVADTGPGIPPAQHARIFERFQRAHDSRGRVVEGSGIGLAMVRDIVQLHGGVVELESAVGEGSVFRLRLPWSGNGGAAGELAAVAAGGDDWREELALDGGPAAVVDDAAIPRFVPDGAAGGAFVDGGTGRVLLVEDNPQMRAFVARLLGRRHSVLTAVDGVEALALARRELPDVVLSDVMMPRMDGFELARRLKADPRTRNIPLVLITARHGTEAALEGFAAGADDFLVKPFSPPELLARIDAQLRIRQLTISLLRSEKQAALGIVSAGVAHEVLNPLNVIVNSVPVLDRTFQRVQAGSAKERDLTTAGSLLKMMDTSAVRIRKVVQAFRTFARQEPGKLLLHATRVDEAIEAVLAILQYRFGEQIRVHRDYRFVGPAVCYTELLEQVVMNVLVNASDAIGSASGTIWVTTERVGDDVHIRVRDDGPGVPAAERERIFTPFYTTKPPGSGTGLGLPISREILALHRGTVELLPPGEGRGAEFLISFPFVTPDVGHQEHVELTGETAP
jgi:signal transduction histidine kinase